ncbi:MAG: tryptophan synthase subunit alpha [Phycisphaerae bacterium]
MNQKNRIERAMAHCRKQGQGALLPYFTAGFPDMATTAALVARAARSGAAVIEVGIPYSDSIADGPVIQSSFHTAIEGGFKVEDAFATVAALRGSVEAGLIAMISYSIVYRFGVDRFMEACARVGFDGVLFPDIPVEEAAPSARAAGDHNLCYVGLVAPTTQADRQVEIIDQSSGFIYQVAVAGTTGERNGLSKTLEHEVSNLRRITRLPICVGFGVSSPEHVREVCGFADGAIVGSAIVRRIREGIDCGRAGEKIVDEVAGFVDSLVAACRTDPPN